MDYFLGRHVWYFSRFQTPPIGGRFLQNVLSKYNKQNHRISELSEICSPNTEIIRLSELQIWQVAYGWFWGMNMTRENCYLIFFPTSIISFFQLLKFGHLTLAWKSPYFLELPESFRLRTVLCLYCSHGLD